MPFPPMWIPLPLPSPDLEMPISIPYYISDSGNFPPWLYFAIGFVNAIVFSAIVLHYIKKDKFIDDRFSRIFFPGIAGLFGLFVYPIIYAILLMALLGKITYSLFNKYINKNKIQDNQDDIS